MRQNSRPRIAILMSQDLGYCRRVLSGILRFGTEQGAWEFRDGPPRGDLLPALLRWRPDGILVHLFDPHLAAGLTRFDCPVISTTDTLCDTGFPCVDVDNHAVGVLAARHLLRHGFRHFGWFGSATARFSRERFEGFAAELRRAGREPHALHAEFLPRPPLSELWRPSSRRLETWLEALPKPVAVFCSNDVPARRVAEACARSGLAVPRDVAILGVDNDTSECRLAHPPLSSIDTPSEQIGYLAARLLASLIEGNAGTGENLTLPPLHVVTRASSDALACDHPAIRAALGHIHQSVSHSIQVDEVAKAASVSRRQLERLFQRELRRSVLGVIHEVKIDLAQRLLAESDLPVSEIAERCGFGDPSRLTASFKTITGLTPRAYRKQMGVTHRP